MEAARLAAAVTEGRLAPCCEKNSPIGAMTARRADPASVGARSGRSPEQTAAGGDVKERVQPSRGLNQGEQMASGEKELVEIQAVEGC